MNNGEHLRDAAELEGTLLPIAAQVVVVDVDYAPSVAAVTTTRAAATTTATINSAATDDNSNSSNNVAGIHARHYDQERESKVAIGVPDYHPEHGIGHQLELEHRLAREGTYRGRVYAREEIESIQRISQEALAKVEMECQRVQTANNDKAKSEQSWLGAFDAPVVESPNSTGVDRCRPHQQPHQHETSATKPTSTTTDASSSIKKEPGYQVSEYTIAQYDTVPYETMEYKSVYDH